MLTLSVSTMCVFVSSLSPEQTCSPLSWLQNDQFRYFYWWNLWLPVRGCVSHHSILNSSICLFMTTCAWLCLPSLDSEQFHLFLYDYLCVAVSPISRIHEQKHLFLLWLPVRGCVITRFCTGSLKETNGTVENPITRFWTVPFVSLWLDLCVECHSHAQVVCKETNGTVRIPVMAETQPHTGSLKKQMELYRIEWWLRHSHAQVVLKKQMELFRIEWWETQPHTGSL